MMLRRALLIGLVALAVTLPLRAEFVGWVGIPLIIEDENLIAVPSVRGEANFAAADAILEMAGLDGGAEAERCSDAAENSIVGQSPEAGTLVSAGTLVNLLSSNGEECKASGGGLRPKSRLGL